MKIERTNKAFQPIELKITIETEEELHDLYARLNLRADSVNQVSSCHYKANGRTSYNFYAVLADLLGVD